MYVKKTNKLARIIKLVLYLCQIFTVKYIPFSAISQTFISNYLKYEFEFIKPNYTNYIKEI